MNSDKIFKHINDVWYCPSQSRQVSLASGRDIEPRTEQSVPCIPCSLLCQLVHRTRSPLCDGTHKLHGQGDGL